KLQIAAGGRHRPVPCTPDLHTGFVLLGKTVAFAAGTRPDGHRVPGSQRRARHSLCIEFDAAHSIRRILMNNMQYAHGRLPAFRSDLTEVCTSRLYHPTVSWYTMAECRVRQMIPVLQCYRIGWQTRNPCPRRS